MKPSRRHVTQSQIARKAGVSQAAVSAILSGSTVVNVSPQTRAHVLAVAAKLGYVVRKSAVKAEGDAIDRRNVLIVETGPPARTSNLPWLEDAYQSLMGKIITASGLHLQKRDIGLSVFYLDDPRKLIQWMADSDILGVLWHADDSDPSLLHWVASRFPLTLLNREWKSPVPFDAVSIDQERNILFAADYLWSMGHRKIATFGHYPFNSFSRKRLETYRQFVTEHQIRNYTEFQEVPYSPEISLMDQVRSIIDIWKRLGSSAPTALITSDIFALPLLNEARRAGISIPDDLSVVGIDNTSACSLVSPALTSMDEPFEKMCELGVDMLLRRASNPAEPSQIIHVAPQLILRDSVKRLTGSLRQSIK